MPLFWYNGTLHKTLSTNRCFCEFKKKKVFDCDGYRCQFRENVRFVFPVFNGNSVQCTKESGLNNNIDRNVIKPSFCCMAKIMQNSLFCLFNPHTREMDTDENAHCSICVLRKEPSRHQDVTVTSGERQCSRCGNYEWQVVKNVALFKSSRWCAWAWYWPTV